MKKLLWILFAGLATGLFSACSGSKGRYIDLETGKKVDLEKNEQTGFMINKENGQPIYIYIDTRKNDTVYGKTGEVINGHVYKGEDGKFVFDDDEKLKVTEGGEVKYKDGDYKVEVEKDGDMTTKNGDKKTEIDGKTGEKKVKKD